MTDVVDAADMLRAALADAHDWLDHDDWKTSAAAWCQSIWFTDCRSCSDTLAKPIATDDQQEVRN